MESGSSGSFQSSSGGVGGGDEEYDSSSRPESISSFLNNSSQQRNPFFRPPSNQNLDLPLFLQNHQQYDNNEQMGWSRGVFITSSQTNYANFGNFSSTASAASSSSLPSSASQPLIIANQSPLANSLLQYDARGDPNTTVANQPPPPEVASTKSTKKRTRASRKAPTTVLRTDTTNFRQMVQQYTGVSSPPPFSSNPGGSAFGRPTSMRGGHQFDGMSSFYPLRPSAQRLVPNNPNSLLGSGFIMNNAAISNNTLGQLPHQSMQNQLLNSQPFRTHHQESSRMSIPLSLDELGSFVNQQRASEVERQATWRVNQERRNLNNEGQDGQHQ